MFGAKTKLFFSSPLEKGDHPELDLSDRLDSDGFQKCQSMVGTIQWAVSLGKLVINASVMTLSYFRAYPREGHLDFCKRFVSYLAKFKWATISIRTKEPDLSSMPTTLGSWEESVCVKVK